MSIAEKLKQGPTLSYEFFPPKNPAAWATLYGTLAETTKLGPDFVSVTYGAGGSTRSKTVDIVGRIQGELGIEAMAHLTCVGHSREELRGILQSLWNAGIRHVLALRGDPPKGDTAFRPHPDGFEHATELIRFIKENFSFTVGCAFYPEKHPEAKTLEADMAFLKLKQDNGADFAVSQLFFDNGNFLRFRDEAAKIGITMPLLAGVMPVLEITQLPRFRDLSGCVIPDALVKFLGDGTDTQQKGVDYATRQCRELLDNGVSGLHLYCLNKHQSVVQITANLRDLGVLTRRVP
ncbi:MAG TPA: methylenetetrahydrofolate reductase [NAD(P)H] [Fibrobacteres bacterium]|jgi:methylenetetrahydrofolate reductase (NADPH)|nr:methylenetetrahydrofolate reductase [NAD(P)H] [Fibrobacterota bacterium]